MCWNFLIVSKTLIKVQHISSRFSISVKLWLFELACLCYLCNRYWAKCFCRSLLLMFIMWPICVRVCSVVVLKLFLLGVLVMKYGCCSLVQLLSDGVYSLTETDRREFRNSLNYASILCVCKYHWAKTVYQSNMVNAQMFWGQAGPWCGYHFI